MFGADRPNYVEIESHLRKAIEGDRPGIRKKSYHRAIKRGAPWALIRKSMDESMGRLQKLMFPIILEKIMKPNPLMGLVAWLPKDE